MLVRVRGAGPTRCLDLSFNSCRLVVRRLIDLTNAGQVSAQSNSNDCNRPSHGPVGPATWNFEAPKRLYDCSDCLQISPESRGLLEEHKVINLTMLHVTTKLI